MIMLITMKKTLNIQGTLFLSANFFRIKMYLVERVVELLYSYMRAHSFRGGA